MRLSVLFVTINYSYTRFHTLLFLHSNIPYTLATYIGFGSLVAFPIHVSTLVTTPSPRFAMPIL